MSDTLSEVDVRAELREMEQRINAKLETIAGAVLMLQESMQRFDAMAEIVGQMFPNFALTVPQPADEEDAAT